MNKINDINEMFGLTLEQTILMFSVQKMITVHDIELSKDKKLGTEKEIGRKNEWLNAWQEGIMLYLKDCNKQEDIKLVEKERLGNEFLKALSKNENKTWYYIILLESLIFVPYTALGKDEDKIYSKCNFNEKKSNEFINNFFEKQGEVSPEFIKRLEDTYEKSLNKISGKKAKLAVKVASVIAVSAIAAAIGGTMAGPIAVKLVGAQFAGLHGAALTSASLALLGGGAIINLGAGMLGGTIVIAGGGALLGLAGGAAAVMGATLLLSAPDYTLTQAAKLETVIREIILNEQQDILSAQEVMKKYKEQIVYLNNCIEELKLKNDRNKEEIKKMTKCMDYLEKSYRNIAKFESAYEIGYSVQEKEHEK